MTSRSSLSSRVFSMAMTAWRGEVLDQFDLLVGEGTHLLAIDDDDADQRILLEHRDRKCGAIVGKLGAGDDDGVALDIGRCRPDVVDVRHLLRERRAAQGGAGMRANRRVAPPLLSKCGRCVMQRDTSELVPLAEEQAGKLGLAQARGVRQHGLEHRLQLTRRTRNDAKNLRGRGLLLQASKIVVRAAAR